MSLLHTCYELAKNLLSTCYASPRSKFIFLRERISDKWRFLLVWPKENMQRLYHSGKAFLLPKKLEKCRKRAAETSEFCRSLSEYEMYLTKAKCAASYLWWDNRNRRIAKSQLPQMLSSSNHNSQKFRLGKPALKVSFWKMQRGKENVEAYMHWFSSCYLCNPLKLAINIPKINKSKCFWCIMALTNRKKGEHYEKGCIISTFDFARPLVGCLWQGRQFCCSLKWIQVKCFVVKCFVK